MAELPKEATASLSCKRDELYSDRSLDSTASSSHKSLCQGKRSQVDNGPSLVFSRGGNFLAKYQVQRGDQEGTTKQQEVRRRSEPSCSVATPDRMNIQLNSMLVHARHHQKLLQVVESHLESFNAVNLITALHRLGSMVVSSRRASVRRDMRFKQLIRKLSETLHNANANELKPQDLSNIAWALTKLGLLNAALFGVLSRHIVRTISDFEPVNLSMMLWAFARAGFLDEKMFRVAAVEVKEQLHEFEPQQIANTTWAMAKSGFVDEELFLSAADIALQKLAQFQPMNYSMLLYSFSLAKLPHPNLFEKVGKRCTVQALSSAQSSPHVITNLASAFSDVGAINVEVFNAIAQVASTSLHDFRSQQIVILIEAFAKAKVRHEGLLASVSSTVVSRSLEFKHDELQGVMEAFEALGAPTIDIAQALASEQQELKPNFRTWTYLLVPVALIFVLLCILQGRYTDFHDVGLLRSELGGS